MNDPAIRPTASTINDDQLDALFEGLDEIYKKHYPHVVGDWCVECQQKTPCQTVRTIQLTRLRLEEAHEPEEADRLA